LKGRAQKCHNMRMRSISLALAIAAVLSGCRMPWSGPARELYSTEVFEVTHETGVWDEEYGRTDDPANCSFRFRVLRYGDGIGVKATVRDDRVVTDSCPCGAVSCASWDDDTLQCFFDGNNDRAKDARAGNGLRYGGEFTLVANGAAQSDYSSKPRGFGDSWRGTVSVRENPDGGYLLDYDLWFSWSCIGRRRPPADSEDVTFGFNICVHDDDDGGRNDRALYWKGSSVRPYRDESGFGTITLKGRK